MIPSKIETREPSQRDAVLDDAASRCLTEVNSTKWADLYTLNPTVTFDRCLDIVAENPLHRYLWDGESFLGKNMLEFFLLKRDFIEDWEEVFAHASRWLRFVAISYDREFSEGNETFPAVLERIEQNIPGSRDRIKRGQRNGRLINSEVRYPDMVPGHEFPLCKLKIRPPANPEIVLEFQTWGLKTRLPLHHHERLEPDNPQTLRFVANLIAQHADEIYENAMTVEDESDALGYEGPNPLNVEAKARRLQKRHGIMFRKLPKSIFPNMPYTTPDDFVESGATHYSLSQVNRTIREGDIPAARVDRKILLTPDSIEQLLERQQDSAAGELDQRGRRLGGGRRPGSSSRGQSRRKQPWPIQD
jgi:hypothetical protein